MTSEYIRSTMFKSLQRCSMIRSTPLISLHSRYQHTHRINHLYNSNNIIHDVHSYLNSYTHLSGPTELDTAINPIVPIPLHNQSYLQHTNSTYKHIADMKYRLHRFVPDNESSDNILSVDILIDHSMDANVNTDNGRYDISVINGNERISFICQPIFYRQKLVNPNIIDTITVTEMFSNTTRTMLASDMSTNSMLQFFHTIGIDQQFITFVQQHSFEIYRTQDMH